MGGGAWPFLVGEVTCLVNSDNGRDLDLLTRSTLLVRCILLRGTLGVYLKEVRAYNRSVMPLDGLGCTCATMTESASITLLRREWAIF
jgi:hypothetical protein